MNEDRTVTEKVASWEWDEPDGYLDASELRGKIAGIPDGATNIRLCVSGHASMDYGDPCIGSLSLALYYDRPETPEETAAREARERAEAEREAERAKIREAHMRLAELQTLHRLLTKYGVERD